MTLSDQDFNEITRLELCRNHQAAPFSTVIQQMQQCYLSIDGGSVEDQSGLLVAEINADMALPVERLTSDITFPSVIEFKDL